MVQFFTVPNTPYYLASLIYITHETPEGRNPGLRGSRNQRKTSFRHQTSLDVNLVFKFGLTKLSEPMGIISLSSLSEELC